jgi:hypothetical protein
MAEYIISQSQLELIQSRIVNETPYETIKRKWEKLSEEEQKVVVDVLNHLYPQKKNLKEAKWYNTAMDFLGIIDPTPITDSINAISYFTQGDTLFGILSLVSAIPMFGDFVGKSVMGAAKLGTTSTKALDKALKIMKTATPGSKQYLSAAKLVDDFAKAPNALGKMIQKFGGKTGDNIIGTLDALPLGPFNGLKNTMTDYLKLLQNAGKKSVGVKGLATSVSADFAKGVAKADDVKALIDLVKGTKIFDAATLSKPGGLSQIFFGGVPRLFRSPEGRRVKILMGQTKWWLGFLDYIGVGNFKGPDELSQEMGEAQMLKKIEQYNQTPQALENFDDQFGEIDRKGSSGEMKYGDITKFAREKENTPKISSSPIVSSPTTSDVSSGGSQKPEGDAFAGFLKSMLLGRLNPIPGI